MSGLRAKVREWERQVDWYELAMVEEYGRMAVEDAVKATPPGNARVAPGSAVAYLKGRIAQDFGMDRLGYIVLPYLLRRMIREAKSDSLKLEDGCYPQRKDGSYGWFIVEETADENENSAEYNSGCNSVWSKDKEAEKARVRENTLRHRERVAAKKAAKQENR